MTEPSRFTLRPGGPTALVVTLILLLHAWMAVSATRHESTTVDEMAHLTAGHALWATGDYRMQPENGNLPQRWEGLPAWLLHRPLPPASNPGWSQPNVWTVGHTYFHQMGNDLGAILLAGRAMNVVWSVATGLLIFLWTRRLFGAGGAWVALVLWAFCPTFLAHGALATSDMCMTFFMLASVGAYWVHLRDFRWQTGLLSAGTLGLAFVAKYSAVLLGPMLGLLAVVRILDHRAFMCGRQQLESRGARAGAVVISALGHVAAVWIVIWAFHGFHFAPVADPALVNDYTRPWAVVLASIGGPIAALVTWAHQHHVLPDAYLYGFAFVVDLSKARGAFLNGATSQTGWVQFFPYAFLVKTPPPVLLALAASVAVAIVEGWRRGRAAVMSALYRTAPLLVLFGVYWIFSLTSKLNIGQRHLLPIYPVIFIGTGVLGWAAAAGRRVWITLVAALVVAQVATSLLIRPHYLAYFNGLAGGPSEGYRHLVDSSLDWGQDLPGLAQWLEDHHLPARGTPVYLAYFGTGDPEYYGIRATAMVPLLRQPSVEHWYRLQAGVYCISATLLSQAYSRFPGEWTPEMEKHYQELHAAEAALLFYDEHPANRADLEKGAPANKWRDMWQTYEQLRFKRLCYLLRARQPDAQIGYSINIYRLTAQDVAAATGDTAQWLRAIEAAPRQAAPDAAR